MLVVLEVGSTGCRACLPRFNWAEYSPSPAVHQDAQGQARAGAREQEKESPRWHLQADSVRGYGVSKGSARFSRDTDFGSPTAEIAHRLIGVRAYIRGCNSWKIAKSGPRIAVLAAFCLGVSILADGDDLTTSNGKSFHDVQVLSRTSTDLFIQSREGQFQIAVADLKPNDRERFSKDLTKAIELPALTVIGAQGDLSVTPGLSRGELDTVKEMQRHDEAQEDARRKKIESYQPLQILPGLNFSLGSIDPKNDSAILPDYVSPEYSRESPNIVEKDLKVFSNALSNQSQ